MCDEIFYSQDCDPRYTYGIEHYPLTTESRKRIESAQGASADEIAMVIAGSRDDIGLGKIHKKKLRGELETSYQHRQNVARHEIEARKDSSHEYFESVFLTEAAGMKGHSNIKQTEATKDWIRKIFAENAG